MLVTNSALHFLVGIKAEDHKPHLRWRAYRRHGTICHSLDGRTDRALADAHLGDCDEIFGYELIRSNGLRTSRLDGFFIIFDLADDVGLR